jgi:TolA-binding protein
MTYAAHTQPLPPFDELVELAQANPQAFTILKKEICEEAICAASDKMQDRLWALQSHIDRVIETSKNANHINVRLMKELTKQVIRFQDTLESSAAPQNRPSATILQFPR